MPITLPKLVKEINRCHICAQYFEHAPNPIVQLSSDAKILLCGQAPGRLAHETGIPFSDPSGDRLRDWLGLSTETFYDASKIAILPMGFCYPGMGDSGDLPPRKECAETWRHRAIALLPNLKLTLLIGNYALAWHLKDRMKRNLTETVRAWKDYLPEHVTLPHPSPRNNIWLKRNPWFESDLLPNLKDTIKSIMDEP